LSPLEIDVLHAQASALEKAQAGTVQKRGHELRQTAQVVENEADFFAAQHHGEPRGGSRSDDIFHPRQIPAEYFAIEEEESAQRLVLGRRSNPAFNGQARQELGDLGLPHFLGMPLAVKQDESTDPVNVRLLGPAAVVAAPDSIPYLVEEPWLPRGRRCGSGGLGRIGAAHL